MIDKHKLSGSKIYVTGIPNTKVRLSLIEEAISKIMEDPKNALKDQYLGVKNYAHFGDQRSDHEYGYGPKHGNIVFRIGRTDHRSNVVLGEAEIYHLLSVRDFKPFYDDKIKPYTIGNSTSVSLSELLDEYWSARRRFEHLDKLVNEHLDYNIEV